MKWWCCCCSGRPSSGAACRGAHTGGTWRGGRSHYAQTAVVALLVDAAVDGLVDANATALDAVVHVLVALVEDLLAAADAGLDLPRPGALPLQQLLDLLVRRA